jgi:predicted PurR-regulated permease PerM
LPPALTLAAQVVLGALSGPLGLTLSTPLFVLGVSAVQTFREEKSDRAGDGEDAAARTGPRTEEEEGRVQRSSQRSRRE